MTAVFTGFHLETDCCLAFMNASTSNGDDELSVDRQRCTRYP